MVLRSASVRLSSASVGKPGPVTSSGRVSGVGAATAAWREARPRRIGSRNLAMVLVVVEEYDKVWLVWSVRG